MKFSVITVTKNSSKTIARTVNSVISQKHVNVEHIIKDACSADDTVKLAKLANKEIVVVSKPDIGIYDAMNQGFFASSGDIIAFLNSDDYYIDENVLSDVLVFFESCQCDFVYGDITMTSISGEIVRQWRSIELGEAGLVGRQIPHPGIFIKRAVLDKLNSPFDQSYKISADLKQQLIVINKMKCSGRYLRRSLVIMETGGESTGSIRSYLLGWKESVRAYNEVFGRGGLWFVIRKILSKIKGVRVRAQIRYFGS